MILIVILGGWLIGVRVWVIGVREMGAGSGENK
jgi:hypothetical protein